MFCTPVFCLIHRFFSLSSFVIPSKCLKNFICAASKRCSSLFFSNQASLPNFNAALAVLKFRSESKAALKFGSEAWLLKKREEQRLEATQMKWT